MEGMVAWQSRPLDRLYPVIFVDVIVVKIREGQVANRPIYLAYVAHVDTNDPLLFVVVEHWASAEARDRHLQSPHFMELGREVDESGRLTHHEFHVIEPL